ncbi:MAG TPA: cytochrome c-type biogenesis protein [Burkholderiales bacterium]|nr:cytochrome c-type biogenesis protein [Burkholderiales bacterium]
MRNVLLLCAALLAAAPLHAKQAVPAGDDPVVEKRAVTLEQQLRCLVCQNETIADSQADLAKDLRKQIREQIKAGRSDDQIKQYLVARYGDFVLYKPPFMATTVLLWAGPFALLLGGLIALFVYLRRRRGRVARAPLSDEQRSRAEALLDAKEDRA